MVDRATGVIDRLHFYGQITYRDSLQIQVIQATEWVYVNHLFLAASRLHSQQFLPNKTGNKFKHRKEKGYMQGFKMTTADNEEIKFKFYQDEAPITSKAFAEILPFTRIFYHARVSGQEIWIDNPPPLDIIQENASVFTTPGEVVFGPSKPARTKTANCFGIYYGYGQGLDAANIFAKVIESDLQKLIDLGNEIWKNGSREITIVSLD